MGHYTYSNRAAGCLQCGEVHSIRLQPALRMLHVNFAAIKYQICFKPALVVLGLLQFDHRWHLRALGTCHHVYSLMTPPFWNGCDLTLLWLAKANLRLVNLRVGNVLGQLGHDLCVSSIGSVSHAIQKLPIQCYGECALVQLEHKG